MLRKVSIVVILAGLLVPLIASAQGQRAEPRLVGVSLNSRPEFAEVRVDGVFVGTTPLPYRLAAGVHKIDMTRRGFETWSRQLFVNSEVPTNVTALLENTETKPCGK